MGPFYLGYSDDNKKYLIMLAIMDTCKQTVKS